MKNNMKNRWPLTPFIAVLLVGLVLLVGTRLPGAFAARQSQVNITQLQSSPGSVSGLFNGDVALDWTVIGVYSEPLATPTKQPTTTPPPSDLGVIDLALQLAQTGSQLTGFVDLENTLVYTGTGETIMATPVGPTPLPGTPTPVAAELRIGPKVTGTLNGANLQLESERVAGVIAGVPIQRQFRLTGVAVWEASVVTISGEYRETIWGYVPKPLTVIGHFKLRQPIFGAAPSTDVTSTPTRTPAIGGSTSTPTATATAIRTPTSTATIPGPPTATTSPTPVPALPITLALASGNRAVELDWNVTNDPGVLSYRILRAVGANGTFQPINDNWLDTVYFDTDNNDTNDLVPTTSYCYQVEARRDGGAVALTSNVSCAVFGPLDLYVRDAIGRTGETVIVQVNIRNADGLRITSSDIWLDYNSNIIESVAISRTALTAAYLWDQSVLDTDPPNPPMKRVKIAYTNINPDELHGNGSLFWLIFKVKGQPGQTTPLDLKEFIPGSGGSSIQDASDPLLDVPLRLTDGVFTVAAADQPCILGDVVCDGVIRAQDAGIDLRFAVGLLQPSTLQQNTGDVNGNSKIDAPDATMILYRAVNPTFPLPRLAAASASAVQADPNVRLSNAQAQQGANVCRHPRCR